MAKKNARPANYNKVPVRTEDANGHQLHIKRNRGMVRLSSKGNPYHDERGRFTSAGGGKVTTWASFGERVNLSGVEDIIKFDKEKTQIAMTDGRRHYHNQSIGRQENLRKVSDVDIGTGLSQAERTRRINRQLQRYKKLTKYYKDHSPESDRNATVVIKMGGSNLGYQVVDSPRLVKIFKKGGTINTSATSHIPEFSGYTVEFFNEGNVVRSCPKGASYDTVVKHISNFCQKHKKEMGNHNTCLKIWTKSNGQIAYMPTYHFDTEAEAQAFAKTHKNARIVNHDDGRMA